MNFRKIEVFRAVMEYGTMSAAAKALHVSQPSISKHIQDLEEDLSLSLFKREQKKLVPTQEARTLFDLAERAFTSINELRRFAQELSGTKVGHLAIAAVPALSHQVLPLVVTNFLKNRPNIKLSIHAQNSNKIMEWVEAGQIDFGLAYSIEKHPFAKIQKLLTMELVCIVSKDHALASRDSIGPKDLASERFISLAPILFIRQRVNQVFRDAGVIQGDQIYTELGSFACAAVGEGAGVSLVDPYTLSAYKDIYKIAIIKFRPKIIFNLNLIVPVGKPLSLVSQAFIETLRKEIKKPLADMANLERLVVGSDENLS